MFGQRLAGVWDSPLSVTRAEALDRAAMRAEPDDPPLAWSRRTTIRRRPLAIIARLVSASSRLGVLKPAPTSMPCTPMKTASRCRLRSAAIGDRSDQGVGGGAEAAGQEHGVAAAPERVEQVGDPDRVGDDREAGDRDEVLVPARSVVVPAETAIAEPGWTSWAARAAMASFWPSWLRRLGGEAGLGDARLGTHDGAAVHLLEGALARASARRSRRMVMSETPRVEPGRLTRTMPSRSSRARISDVAAPRASGISRTTATPPASHRHSAERPRARSRVRARGRTLDRVVGVVDDEQPGPAVVAVRRVTSTPGRTAASGSTPASASSWATSASEPARSRRVATYHADPCADARAG